MSSSVGSCDAGGAGVASRSGENSRRSRTAVRDEVLGRGACVSDASNDGFTSPSGENVRRSVELSRLEPQPESVTLGVFR